MPAGGRRILSRIQSGNSYSSSGKSGGSGNGHGADDPSGNMVPLASMVVLPKHSVLPDIPTDSHLYFECMLFVFGFIMMCLQYINLYKTVWWLPQSHAQYALNFYLIDFYLVGLISVLLATRFLVYFVQESCFGFKVEKVEEKNKFSNKKTKSGLNEEKRPATGGKPSSGVSSRDSGGPQSWAKYIRVMSRRWWLWWGVLQAVTVFTGLKTFIATFIHSSYCSLMLNLKKAHYTRVMYWLVQSLKVLLTNCYMVGLVCTCYMVATEHGVKTCLFLFYPVVIYLSMFGLAIKPLYQKFQAWPRPALGGDRLHSGPQRVKVRDDQPLVHICTLTPDIVRDEVDVLKKDFNMRLKQILFNSLTTSFYATGVPVWFSQNAHSSCDACWNTLYYDSWWMWQHVCLTWLSALLMLTSHFLPPHYLHLLHKSARHLGRWQKMEARHAHVPYNAWSELQVWPQGALVKHVRGLFKAEGINVTAEPGNSVHSRFYLLFHQPQRVMNWLVCLTGLVVGYQMFRLVQSSEWSHVISLALLMFCNFYTLFKLVRDWFIMKKVYKQHDYGVTN